MFARLAAQGSNGNAGPVVSLGSCSLMYAKYGDIYMVGVTGRNSNVAMFFAFLDRLAKLLVSYFGVLSEEAIQKNFVLLHEILDEVIDFGYPQVLETTSLKQYIFERGVKADPQEAKAALPPSSQHTGAVAHRAEGIKYNKNEVYLDVVERMQVLTSADGVPLRAEVEGKIVCKSYLSGMPMLKIGLNDKAVVQNDAVMAANADHSAHARLINMADVKFHQCVNLSKFDVEKAVSFTPPDGEFELMSYRISDGISFPFKILPNINELGRTRMQIFITIKSQFPTHLLGLNVKLSIPVPKNTAKVTAKISGGKYKYDVAKNVTIWKIKRFPGETEHVFSAEVDLVSTTAEKRTWFRPPISVDFEVPMFGASGLQVLYLKVWEKSGYASTKWVRKVCKSGDWSVRTTGNKAKTEERALATY